MLWTQKWQPTKAATTTVTYKRTAVTKDPVSLSMRGFLQDRARIGDHKPLEQPVMSGQYLGAIDLFALRDRAQADHVRRTNPQASFGSAVEFHNHEGLVATVEIPNTDNPDHAVARVSTSLILGPVVATEEYVWITTVATSAASPLDRVDPQPAHAMIITIMTKADPAPLLYTEIHDYVRLDDGTLTFTGLRTKDDMTAGNTIGETTEDTMKEWLESLPDKHPFRLVSYLMGLPFREYPENLYANRYGIAAILSSLTFGVSFHEEEAARLLT